MLSAVHTRCIMETNLLQLNSPVQATPRTYTWPHTSSGSSPSGQYPRAVEIVDTIKWVCEDYPDLWTKVGKTILDIYEALSFETLSNLCNEYNETIKQTIWNLECKIEPTFPSARLLQHILDQVYNAAVTDPGKLNQYEPFSPETYGEATFPLISKIIEKLEINENDVFIDLGSGTGNLVLQVAASSSARFCYGIEKASCPATYAKEMDSEFRSWMAWYGKKYGSYELIQGDFLSEELKGMIEDATIIFANNLLFGPVLDHQLKQIFAELKDGTKIVSSKAFCATELRITERNVDDLGSILNCQLLFEPVKDSVSWTQAPVPFYLHVIDRTKRQRYLKLKQDCKTKNNGNRRKARRPLPSSFISSTTTESTTSPTSETDPPAPAALRAWYGFRWVPYPSVKPGRNGGRRVKKRANSLIIYTAVRFNRTSYCL